MSRRPRRRRRRRRPSPAEEPAAPAGREHRLFLPVPGRAQDSGAACPAVPHSRPPCAGRREDQPPSGGGVLPQEPGRRPPLRGACVFPSSIPPPDPSPAAPEAGPRAVRGGDEATRLASGLEARGADVRRSESVPGERSSFLKHTRAANKLCFPPCSTQATFGWKTRHLAMTGRPSSGEDGMHTLGAAVGRKVL